MLRSTLACVGLVGRARRCAHRVGLDELGRRSGGVHLVGCLPAPFITSGQLRARVYPPLFACGSRSLLRELSTLNAAGCIASGPMVLTTSSGGCSRALARRPIIPTKSALLSTCAKTSPLRGQKRWHLSAQETSSRGGRAKGARAEERLLARAKGAPWRTRTAAFVS